MEYGVEGTLIRSKLYEHHAGIATERWLSPEIPSWLRRFFSCPDHSFAFMAVIDFWFRTGPLTQLLQSRQTSLRGPNQN